MLQIWSKTWNTTGKKDNCNSSSITNLTSSNDWPPHREFVVAEPEVLIKCLVFPVVARSLTLKEWWRISKKSEYFQTGCQKMHTD